MRFYVVEIESGVVGCETSLAAAHATARSCTDGRYSILRTDVEICTETVRRLLGNLGGGTRGI